MTFDERFLFFLIAAILLPSAGYWYVQQQLGIDPGSILDSYRGVAMPAALLGGALLLVMGQRWNRRNKGLFDLNGLDSVTFGAGQCLAVLPGSSGALGMMIVALFRNYHLEAATKLIALFSLPFIGFTALNGLAHLDLHGAQPIAGVGWLQWGTSVAVAGAATYFGLKVLTDQIRRTGYGAWIAYRIVLALGMLGLYFWRPA